MHLWCIQCNERPVTVTTFVRVLRGRRNSNWQLEVCYQCWLVLETMMDAGHVTSRLEPSGRQLKLEVASRT